MSIVSTVPRGTAFARFCKALAVAKGDVLGAEAYAQGQAWLSTPQVALALKALVNPLDTVEVETAIAPIAYDLAELLRPQTILGKMTGTRRAPFRTRLLVQTVGGHGAWVHEGKAIPVSAAGIAQDANLAPLKVAAIRVLTNELLRTAVAGSEALIAADCASSLVEAMDAALVDPDNSGSFDEMPASIAFGAPQFVSTGAALAAVDHDLALLVQSLVAAEMSLSSAVFVLHPTTAVHLALLRGDSGAPAFPLVSARGGSLLGINCITSTACSASGSPGERFILLVEQSDLLVADDGAGDIQLSTQAAIQMQDAPTDDANYSVSLWQNNLIGLRCVRVVNWLRRRTGAVAVLVNVNY